MNECLPLFDIIYYCNPTTRCSTCSKSTLSSTISSIKCLRTPTPAPRTRIKFTPFSIPKTKINRNNYTKRMNSLDTKRWRKGTKGTRKTTKMMMMTIRAEASFNLSLRICRDSWKAGREKLYSTYEWVISTFNLTIWLFSIWMEQEFILFQYAWDEGWASWNSSSVWL